MEEKYKDLLIRIDRLEDELEKERQENKKHYREFLFFVERTKKIFYKVPIHMDS